MSWPSEPVKLGQYAIDEGEPSVPRAAEGESLCTSCFHQVVCVVARAATQLGQVTIGSCEHVLPIEEQDVTEPPQK